MCKTIKLYSNDCPRCKVLEKKLELKNIPYEKVDFNVEELLNKGFTMMPIINMDGNYYEYKDAIKLINDF